MDKTQKSNKTLTIFFVVISIVLVSTTGVTMFYLYQEQEMRKTAEYNLEQIRLIEARLQSDVKDSKKQIFLLEEKNKEAEGKIENLLEEVDLEQGLREEIKKENRELRELVEKEKQEKKELREEFVKSLEESEEQVSSLQGKLSELEEKKLAAEESQKVIGDKYQRLKTTLEQIYTQQYEEQESARNSGLSTGDVDVELDKIVINPDNDNKGKIISVDKETDFVIVDLGEKDGITVDSILSIYREDSYLGDVKVSRVLPEMSAADFIPPLESKKVQMDDKVLVKQ